MHASPAFLLSLAILAVWSPPTRAEVYIRVPFVTIRVGRPAPVAPPVGVPLPPPTAPSAPVAPGTPPPVPVEPLPPSPVPAVVPAPISRAPTLSEFAASFRPVPGRFEVVMEHPVTHLPVQVCFTLPPGTPRRVRVHRREIEFVYAHCRVEIRFLHNGTVRVRT